MTEEIKILNHCVEFYKKFCDGEENLNPIITGKEVKALEKVLNYITNLQKENMKLISENEAIKNIKYTVDETIYKQRNKKAVEYINNLRDESAEREGFYNCFPDDLYIADIEYLLNILQGGDE